jgi:hypothetical protein
MYSMTRRPRLRTLVRSTRTRLPTHAHPRRQSHQLCNRWRVCPYRDGVNSEFRVIGQLGTIPLGVGAYAHYPAGTVVEE